MAAHPSKTTIALYFAFPAINLSVGIGQQRRELFFFLTIFFWTGSDGKFALNFERTCLLVLLLVVSTVTSFILEGFECNLSQVLNEFVDYV